MAIGAAIAGGLASSVGGSLLGGGKKKKSGPREFDLSNDMFNILFNRTKGPDQLLAEATGELGAFQQQQLQGAGLFGDMALNNQSADLAGQLGQDFLGGLQAFDPMQIAEQQFNLLNPLLQQQFEQDRLSQEGRLFAQGQLGGTSGANRQGALFDTQEDARRKLLFESFGQGLAAQQQQASLGAQLSQLNPALRGLFQNLSGGALQNVLGIEQSAINRLLAGAQVEGTGGGGSTTPTAGQAFGAGLLNSGIKNITGAIDSAFQPSTDFTAFQSGNNAINGFINPVGR